MPERVGAGSTRPDPRPIFVAKLLFIFRSTLCPISYLIILRSRFDFVVFLSSVEASSGREPHLRTVICYPFV